MATTAREIYIREAAELIGRLPHTIREWEREGYLPVKLRSKRNSRGWRYWTPEQIEGIKTWLVKTDRRPGKSFTKRPSEEKVQQHLRRMRGPRKPVEHAA